MFPPISTFWIKTAAVICVRIAFVVVVVVKLSQGCDCIILFMMLLLKVMLVDDSSIILCCTVSLRENMGTWFKQSLYTLPSILC